MLSIFIIFFVELFAFRWGSAKLAKLGAGYGMYSSYRVKRKLQAYISLM